MPGCLAVHFSHVLVHLFIIAAELWRQRNNDGGYRAKDMVAYTTLLFHFLTALNFGVVRALYADSFIPRSIQFATAGFLCSQTLLIQTMVFKNPPAVVAACAAWAFAVLVASAFAYEYINAAARSSASITWEYGLIGLFVGPIPSIIATYGATQNDLELRNMFVILRKQELITSELTDEMDEMVESRRQEANIPHSFDREVSKLRELELIDIDFHKPLEIPRTELLLGPIIGSGAFGQVCSASLSREKVQHANYPTGIFNSRPQMGVPFHWPFRSWVSAEGAHHPCLLSGGSVASFLTYADVHNSGMMSSGRGEGDWWYQGAKL